MEPRESVIFQPVLQAYPTRHSWIITAHVSLGNFKCHWKLFNRQLTRMQQFLRSLDQHPSAPTQLLTTLQLELSNIQGIYKSSETTITSAINLLNSNQLQTRTQCRRSQLPFLGDALSWLTGTATTKDIHSIKTRINQLIATQTSQCNTLVHIVSILNVTRYATQVNRHSINNLIDAIYTTSQDINNLYNLTTSLAASINFNQMILHIRSVFANLQDSLHYLWTVSTHTMEYIDDATSSILSPHVLPVVDLQKMLQHIADTLPPTLHLPISPEDTLHFYRYLRTHVLIENKQSCQITIHQAFTLDIPHRNYSAHYDINTRYFRVTKDATMGVELSTAQFQTCQQANGQFYHISTPFQPLANPPTCIAALYAKSKASMASKCSLQLCKTTTTALPTQITPDVWILTTPVTAPVSTITLICPEKTMEMIAIWQPIHILKLPMTCSATSAHFYLPPRYETLILNVNVSLDMANLQLINITALHFHVWQHIVINQSDMQLQHLVTIPSIPVYKVYQHLLNSTMQLTPFNTELSEDTDSLWSVFTHPGIYISALGLIIPVGVGLFCCYFFWCQPARLVCWPLQSGNTQYTIVDDNVEVAPIYRCDGKATKPTRPHKNHGLAIEHLPTWLESRSKLQLKLFAVPIQGSLGKSSKIQEMQECT